MIVDGVEVLYTMRNGKIVDPNIPTDGLVCYLDARGKNNTDVYRNTLLDLSGNGNHGTLQNFNFTEESGYVKGLSEGGASGLKFDGVDDTMSYSHNLKETDPRTIFIDMELEQSASEQVMAIRLPFGVRIVNGNDYVYSGRLLCYFDTGENRILKGTHKFAITVESTVETSKMYYLGNVYAITPRTDIGSYHHDPKYMEYWGKKILNRAMLWNRVLTDEEITKLMEA